MSLTDALITMNGKATITTADNTAQLTLKSTDADANAGPILIFNRDSASPADNDYLGNIQMEMDNDAGDNLDAVSILAQATDVSNASEDAKLYFYMRTAGTMRDAFHISPTETVFNDDSVDRDFRIESDSNAILFKLQGANSSNSAGTIVFNSSNSDGNFFEAVNPQTGVYSGKFSASAASGNIYGINLNFAGQAPDNNTAAFLIANDSSNIRFRVYADGDVQNHDNSYGSTSDERIKQQIADASSQWDDMKAVKVRKFKFNSDVTEKGDSDVLWRLGVVAQELEASGMNGLVKPEVLYTSDDQEVKDYLYTQKDKDQGLIPDGKDVGDVQIAKKANVGDIKDYKSVKYSILYMKAIKALQEAMAKIETLETKVKALEDA
jgi:hypothetical protein